jgi:hypothetical protein
MLWMLRYRQPMSVVDQQIEAPDYAKAEELGRYICSKQGPSYRFISVKPAVHEITYERMLEETGRTAPATPPKVVSATAEKPKVAEKENLSTMAAVAARSGGSGRVGQ